MPQPAADVYCPECGVPIKERDKQCWLCLRLLAWEGKTVQALPEIRRVEVPQAAPAQTHRYEMSVPAILGIIFAALAMGPAALIACLVTCAVTWSGPGPVQGGDGGPAAAILGIISGAVVLAGFVVLIGALSTRVKKIVAM